MVRHPVDKLYFTVFGGAEISGTSSPATRSCTLWESRRAQRPHHRSPGLKENFWAMGDTGPCGPCSEIHYDMGPAGVRSRPRRLQVPLRLRPLRRNLESRLHAVQSRRPGKLNPLPKPSVDTGAGLERIAAVLQHKISNFDTDLFQPLSRGEAARLANVDQSDPKIQPSLRIIADHSRAATFLISDGVIPSNEGRGYVLRKILRRAIFHGNSLGMDQPFMHTMVYAVRDAMGEAYPEIKDSAPRVANIVLAEEERYQRGVLKALETFYGREAESGDCY